MSWLNRLFEWLTGWGPYNAASESEPEDFAESIGLAPPRDYITMADIEAAEEKNESATHPSNHPSKGEEIERGVTLAKRPHKRCLRVTGEPKNAYATKALAQKACRAGQHPTRCNEHGWHIAADKVHG